jgi:DNA mismatch endonuclease (patch repair protein)
MDTLSKRERSELMSRVRSYRNKSTELVIARRLRSERITGWRRHTNLPGKPDFAWTACCIAVFIDGCFWHGCSTCYRQPKSNIEFWVAKVQANQRRDKRVTAALRAMGWSVIRIKECKLKSETGVNAAVSRIVQRMRLTEPGLTKQF